MKFLLILAAAVVLGVAVRNRGKLGDWRDRVVDLAQERLSEGDAKATPTKA